MLYNGCSCRIQKGLRRKVQELGLSTEYQENEEIRMHICMCAAVAFLKLEGVCDTRSSSKVTKLFDDNWLGEKINTLNMLFMSIMGIY